MLRRIVEMLSNPRISTIRVLFSVAVLAVAFAGCKGGRAGGARHSAGESRPDSDGASRAGLVSYNADGLLAALGRGELSEGQSLKLLAENSVSRDIGYYEELYRKLEGVKEGDIRWQLRAMALHQMAAAGFVQEALLLVPDGNGEIRELLLRSLFEGAQGEDEFIRGLISELKSERDRKDAWEGYVSRWGRARDLKELPLDEIKAAGKEAVNALVGSLRKYSLAGRDFGREEAMRRRSEVAGLLKDLAATKLISPDSVFAFLVSESGDDKMSAYREVEALRKEEGFSDAGKKFADTLLASLVLDDPVRVLEGWLAISKNAEDQRSGEVAFSAWVRQDSRAAADWYASVKDSMSAVQRANFSAVLGVQASRNENFAEAWSWVERIEDPEIKKRSEGQVWEAERDSLRKATMRDPAGTLEGLVSGESTYTEYWLEEAMSTWVARDFDQAVAWNERNWNSMPTSKSQYVAAAFANYSLNHRDLDAARQWSALIQDEKTKARIDAAIAKATEGK